MWAEVQPIKWKIKNWDKLPKSINPNGDGTAKTIYVRSEEALLSGIPFYRGETKYIMWQNSRIRAFLNGYDLYKEIKNGNGNRKYKAKQNFNFEGKGFLNEAFDAVISLTSSNEQVDKKETTESKPAVNNLSTKIGMIGRIIFNKVFNSKGIEELSNHGPEKH